METAGANNDYMMKTKQFIVKTMHFLFTVGLFYLMFLLFRYGTLSGIEDVGFRYNYIVTGGFAILVAFFNRTYNSYLFGYCRIRTLAFAQILSQLFSMTIIFFGVSIGWNQWKAPWWFLALFAFYILYDAGFSFFGNWYYFHLNPPRKTLLIYRNNRDRRRFGSITGKPTERLYQIAKEIKFDGNFEEIKPELDAGYEAVFVAGLNSHCRNGILKYCENKGIRGFFLPHVGDVIMQGAQHIQAFDTPVMMVRKKTLRPEYRVVKRLADFFLSLLGLILLSPVFLITAIAIKCYDRGPVFYKQTRLTKDSREFHVTMSQSMRKRLVFAQYGNKINQIGTRIGFGQQNYLPILFSDRWFFNLDNPLIPDNVESGNEFSLFNKFFIIPNLLT